MILSEKMREAAWRFGEDVQAAREGLGLTQMGLAKILHTYASNVASCEYKGLTPQSKLFFALCEELGLEPEDYGFQTDLVYLAKIAEWRKRKKTHYEK